jgi:hypothetical protein
MADRAKLREAQDHLINLLVQQDEAHRAEDWRRWNALEKQLDAAREAHREALLLLGSHSIAIE